MRFWPRTWKLAGSGKAGEDLVTFLLGRSAKVTTALLFPTSTRWRSFRFYGHENNERIQSK